MSVDEATPAPASTPDPSPTPPERSDSVTEIVKMTGVEPSARVPGSPVSQEELEALRLEFQSELDALRAQIGLLEARATALEAQIAKIEPMVEARLSRTEVLVLKLQGEISTLTKTMVAKDKTEQATVAALGEIKGLLQTLVQKSG